MSNKQFGNVCLVLSKVSLSQFYEENNYKNDYPIYLISCLPIQSKDTMYFLGPKIKKMHVLACIAELVHVYVQKFEEQKST